MPALNSLPLPRVSHPKPPAQTDGLPTLPGPWSYPTSLADSATGLREIRIARLIARYPGLSGLGSDSRFTEARAHCVDRHGKHMETLSMEDEVIIPHTAVIGPADTLDEINDMVSAEIMSATGLIPVTQGGELMSVSHSILTQHVGQDLRFFASLILTYRN